MFDVIIVASGKSTRAGVDKLSVNLGSTTVLNRTVDAFCNIDGIDKIIVVTDKDYHRDGITVVNGGNSRTQSVKNGLLYSDAKYVLVHDGARPFVTRDLIYCIMKNTIEFGSAVPYLPISDSMRKLTDGAPSYVDRKNYIVLQTPQGFIRENLIFAYSQTDDVAYDDSEIYAKFFAQPKLIEGEYTNKKITTSDDLYGYNTRIGSGFDVHYFGGNNPLILGGVTFPNELGLVAHSDGDVVIHAVMDALLNCANLPDIGVLFPDTDVKYKNISSTLLLEKVYALLCEKNVKINNVSVTVIAQKPKLAKFIPAMKENIASILRLSPTQINVNATTTETLGIVGKEKAIAVLAIANVY